MINKVEQYIRQQKMIQKGDHVIAGVSGGADSVCLFLLLHSLRRRMGFSLSVLHVEHGLRGEESLLDMEFVKRLAASCGTEISVFRRPVARIAKEQGLSLEEAGRDARYQAYEAEAAGYGSRAKIALAHHADDNAETLLFHLCRGSGIEGMAGIPPVRGNIIRPLLCASRHEIEDFLRERGQEFRTDATNFDVDFSRNRIRNRVMPELLAVNSKSVAHINQFAGDALEIASFLKSETGKILEKSMTKSKDGGISFAIGELRGYPPALQSRVMLSLLAEASGSRKDISREHAAALLELAFGRTGRRLSLPYGIVAQKAYGVLLLYRENGDNASMKPQEILLETFPKEVALDAGTAKCRVFPLKKDTEIPKNPYTKWFDYDKIQNVPCFRNRRAGDYFALDFTGRRQKLKDYFINEKVPRQKRDQVWLLADGSHILWVIGGRVSEYYKVTEHTKTVLEARFTEEEI